jgi:oligopeptide transport system substrate-binding protein
MRLGFRKLSLPSLAMTLGAFALLASGCGGSSQTGPALAPHQIFNWAIRTGGSGNIKGLDPNTVTSFTSGEVDYLLYDGLVVLDKDSKVSPWGATSWSVSPDGLTYTFHVRPGQHFSDGNPATSSDYAYSLDRSMNPCLASPVSYYLTGQAGNELIKDSTIYNGETCTNGVITAATGQTGPVITSLIGDSINTPDPLTLTITLKAPYAYFLAAMTYPTSFAIEKSVVDAGGGLASSTWANNLSQGSPTGQGTSGMYYLVNWDKSTGRMVLKKNPHWWGNVQYLNEIDLTFFKDTDTMYAAYLAGQFDLVDRVPPQQLAAARGQPDFHETGLLQFFGYELNWKHPPFDSLDARQAFSLALNRTSINTSVLKGSDIPVWNIVPKGMPGYNPAITGPDGVTDPAGDATKAAAHWQAYLTAAGAKAVKKVEFKFVTGSTAAQQQAEAVQQQIQTALPGVTVTLVPIDANTWYDLLTNPAGNFTMMDDGWIDDYPDPQDFLTLLFSKGAQYNVQGAYVPEADTLMHQADAESNQTTRIQDYNKAEQLLVNNVAYLPMFQVKGFNRLRTYVNGYVWNASGFNPNVNFTTMYIGSH